MKVGIFTFPNSKSYGAALQMYALSSAVESLGHDVDVINYYNAFMKAGHHCRASADSQIKHFVKRACESVIHRKLYKRFEAFEKNVVNLYPKKSFSDPSRLHEIGAKYDAVICGSDQVWNPNITNADISYFLDFCGDNTRRIAYAPSFGVEDLSDELKDRVGKELKLFASISVREEQGRKLVSDILGRDVSVVVDPTMLIEQDEWKKIESPYSKVTGDFVLYFTVKHSNQLFKKTREFAKKNGLTMVVVGGNPLKTMRNKDSTVHYAIDISPSQWLWLVHNAKYVATNSFHGTAFSIIYEKDFYLELPPVANSRLCNVVKLMALEDRVLDADTEMIPTTIDFSVARQNMHLLREQSLSYLKDALREDSANG